MDDDDEDVPTCPLCLEELDATDRAVKACQCGYQVCLWCLHTIRERLNRRCPACRTPYDEHNFKFDDFNPEQAAKEAKERKTAKKERERREKLKEVERERERALVLSQQKAKSNLKHARILQRNLVYVIGLSLTLAREEVIRRPDMFGRFGRIIRALVNRSHPFNADAPGGPSISAYVQYARDTDALSAVRGMNNAVYDGREIRCAIATTKYCDALLRNAQVSDPAATYHCGNPQCMYYHSTSHSDQVYTREEVLARQLGPPPPSHLFVAVAPRRPTFNQQYHRSSNSQSTNQSTNPATNRTGPNRQVSANSVSQALSTSANSQPPSANANAAVNSSLSPSGVGLPMSSSPKDVPSSPLAIPRASSSTLSTSPRQSPPSSPPTDLYLGSGRNRSTPPASLSHAHSPPPASTNTSLTTPVPLPSSATWASSQSTPPAVRSPTRRTRQASGETVVRSRPVAVPLRKGEAPPGFEDTSFSRSPTVAPSRPPGFDVSPSAQSAIDKIVATSPDPISTKSSPHTTSEPLNTNTSASSPIARPPGFGHSPPTRPNCVEATHDDVAAAWLQEASGDAVFSSSQDRRSIRPVGEVGVRPGTSAERNETKFEKVLASLGGPLGVSTEVHNMQPPMSMQLETVETGQPSAQASNEYSERNRPGTSLFSGRPHSSLDGSRENAAQASNEYSERNRPGTSLFSGRPHSSLDGSRENAVSKGDLRIGSYPNDLNRAGIDRGIPSNTFPSHTSVPSHLSDLMPSNIVRTAMVLREMRSRSRFQFAQDQSYEVFNGDARASHNGTPSGSMPVYEPNVRHAGPMNSTAQNHHTRPEGISTNDFVDVMGGKKPTVGTRQMRSRFDFADQGSSPPRDVAHLMSRVGDVYNPISHVGGVPPTSMAAPINQATMVEGNLNASVVPEMSHNSGPVSEGFVDSFQQVAGEEKLSSIFSTPKKWGPGAMGPMSNYDHVDEMMHHAAPSSSITGGNNVGVEGVMGMGGAAAAAAGNIIGTGVNNGHESMRRVNTNMGVIGDRGVVGSLGSVVGGGMALPPPGFREATSGISPDTTAGDKTSAITGVATKVVVSGGARKDVKTGKADEKHMERTGSGDGVGGRNNNSSSNSSNGNNNNNVRGNGTDTSSSISTGLTTGSNTRAAITTNSNSNSNSNNNVESVRTNRNKSNNRGTTNNNSNNNGEKLSGVLEVSNANGSNIKNGGVSNTVEEGVVNNYESDTLEEGRKRSHAQRKRDRKARQAREAVGRERKIAKEMIDSNSGAGGTGASNNNNSNNNSNNHNNTSNNNNNNSNNNNSNNNNNNSNTSNIGRAQGSNGASGSGTESNGGSKSKTESTVVEQVKKATAFVSGGNSKHGKGKWSDASSGSTNHHNHHHHHHESKKVPLSATPVVGPFIVNGSEKTDSENKGKRRKDGSHTSKSLKDKESSTSATSVAKGESKSLKKDDGDGSGAVVTREKDKVKEKDDGSKQMSVSELEREVEEARVREAQLQDKLMEITRRLRSYDNVQSLESNQLNE